MTTFRLFEPLGVGQKLGVTTFKAVNFFSAGGPQTNDAADLYTLNLPNRENLLTIII